MDKIWFEFGIPKRIKADNGRPFNGYVFKELFAHFGVRHQRITPLHPEANGLCENFMRNMNKVVRNSFYSGADTREKTQ